MRNYRKILIDFHTPEFLPEVGKKFNPSEWIKTLKNSEIQVVVFCAKDHYGNSYYPTNIGHRHKRINYDFFGGLVKEAKRERLKVFAYYSVGWDNWVAKNYPLWRVVDIKGKFLTGPPPSLTDYNHPYIWHHVCFNSPYREYLLNQLKEIASNYEIDGFWLDIVGFFGESCYCPSCKKKFYERFKQNLPRKDASLSLWKKFKLWKEEEVIRLVKEIKENILTLKPSLLLGVNSVIAKDLDFYSTEFHPPAYTTQSLMARKLRSLAKDKPFEMTMSRNLNPHGEWTLKPLPLIKYELATILANGGEVSVVDQAYPEGILEKSVYELIKEAYQWAKEKETWWEGESFPDIAICDSNSSCQLGDFSPSFKGLAKASLEGGYHLDVLTFFDSGEEVKKYSALILPDLESLSPSQIAILKEYVEKGGSLFFTCQNPSLAEEKVRGNPLLSSLLGIKFLEEGKYSVNYFNLNHPKLIGRVNYPQKILSMPLLIKEKMLKVEPIQGAEILGTFIFPAVETSKRFFVSHQIAPPAKTTDYPAIIFNLFGKGRSIFIPTPIGQGYWKTAFPWLKKIILLSLEILTKEKRPLQVIAPPTLEVTFVKQKDKLIIHLINFSVGRPHGLPWQTKVLPLPLEEPSGGRKIKIRIRKEIKIKRVYLAPRIKDLKFTPAGDFWEIKIPEVKIHQLVVIE